MEHFAGYGFNKSHSTAYALLAYQTAYLKANYPWHFAAALLTIEAQNTDKLALYLGECRERGIPVLPPDINQSQLRFTVEPERGVRFGLTAIKNVGEGAIESLLAVRAAAGTHRVAARAVRGSRPAPGQQARVREPGQGRRVRLAGPARSRARRGARRWPCGRGCWRRSMRRASTARGCSAIATRGRRSCSAGSTTMPRAAGAMAAARRSRPRPPWTETEQLAFEKETLGLYWSGHPVDRYRRCAEGVRRAARRASWRRRRRRRSRADAWGPGGPKPIEPDTSIGGIVAACRQLKTRKGDRMAVFTLEDAHGRRRSRRVPGGLPARRGARSRPARWSSCAASSSATTSRCACWRQRSAPLDSVRERLAPRGRDPGEGARRPGPVRGARRDLRAPSRRPPGLDSRSRLPSSELRVSRPTSRRRSACGRRPR